MRLMMEPQKNPPVDTITLSSFMKGQGYMISATEAMGRCIAGDSFRQMSLLQNS